MNTQTQQKPDTRHAMFCETSYRRYCGLCGKEFEAGEEQTVTQFETRAHVECAN